MAQSNGFDTDSEEGVAGSGRSICEPEAVQKEVSADAERISSKISAEGCSQASSRAVTPSPPL